MMKDKILTNKTSNFLTRRIQKNRLGHPELKSLRLQFTNRFFEDLNLSFELKNYINVLDQSSKSDEEFRNKMQGLLNGNSNIYQNHKTFTM